MPMTNDIERLHGRISELEARVAALEGVTDDSGSWVPWAGGGCPVPPDARVDAELVCGRKILDVRAGGLQWHHWASGGDIIAYRVRP